MSPSGANSHGRVTAVVRAVSVQWLLPPTPHCGWGCGVIGGTPSRCWCRPSTAAGDPVLVVHDFIADGGGVAVAGDAPAPPPELGTGIVEATTVQSVLVESLGFAAPS